MKKSTEIDAIKISSIEIEQFRRFQNVNIDIGSKITIIAGQNGTCKSTLLGMLCQPFTFSENKKRKESSYTNIYNGLKLGDYKTLMHRPFKSKYSEVFRMSCDAERSKEHKYILHLSGNGITNDFIKEHGLYVVSRWRRAKGKPDTVRMVAGPGYDHSGGGGDFPHPVIYLGLNRLCPLAVCEQMTKNTLATLNDDDKDWFNKTHNDVLILRESVNVELVEPHLSTKREFFAPSGSDYPSECCSAGQDSLGQILTAILSFKDLKNKLGKQYHGGLLLIDEFDSTFHPVAQINLLRTLGKAADDYGLQIILTSHSLEVLRQSFENPFPAFVKVVCLKRMDKNVVPMNAPTYEEIESNFRALATPIKKKVNDKAPTTIVFEDAVGNAMFNSLLGNRLKKYVTCRYDFDPKKNAGSISGNVLAYFSQLKIPELQSIIYIIDGDLTHELSEKRPHLLALPGGLYPEGLIYKFLYTLSDTDYFWSSPIKYKNYNSQVCFSGYTDLKVDVRANKQKNVSDDQDSIKKWFKSQLKYWGVHGQLAFERWAKENASIVYEFCIKFLSLLEQIRGELLPDEIKKSILSKYQISNTEEETTKSDLTHEDII